MTKRQRQQVKKSSNKVYLVELEELREHEETDPEHLNELTKQIAKDKILKHPIVVDGKTNIILDGEHRFNALKKLGCKNIPLIYVDYDSPDIEIKTWRNNYNLTKKDVIEAALSGNRFPPKTTCHMIRNSDIFLHVSSIEKRVDVPIEMLRSELKLTPLKNVKTAMEMELLDVLPIYNRFLRTKVIDIPLVLEKKTGVLLYGYEAFHALDLLSTEKAPTFIVNLKEVEIKTSNQQKEKLTKEAIIEAGIRGPKLPPKSFSLLSESVKISVPLEKLTVKKHRNALKVYSSTLDLLCEGWPTPLVKLNSLSSQTRSVWAKLECYNPFSNSVKDRIGWAMVKEAIEKGELKTVLYEATSTNTGIALTSIANLLGLRTRLYIPKTIQKASDIYLEVLGADVIRLPVGLTVDAVSQVEKEAKVDGAAHLNQFENDANFKVHLKYTAKEIDKQLSSLSLKPTCVIGGLGTSGHMSAISYYFKTKYGENVKIVGVQPAPDEVIPGIRRIETGMKWLHYVRFDEIIDVKLTEAIESSIKVARREGLLIGLSSGAVVNAFHKIAEENGVYVLVFPDSGYKYVEQLEKHLTNESSK